MKNKGFFIVLSILLCVALAGVVFFDRQNSAAQTQELQEQAAAARANASQEGAVSASVISESTDTSADSLPADGMETSTSSASADTPSASVSASSAAPTPTPEAVQQITGISCRGDAFFSGSEPSAADRYPAELQQLLQNNGSDLEVFDYTWQMAGSLSQMWYAGIAESEIDPYITKHVNAGVSDPNLTESQLRTDRDSMDLTRDDQGAIPVISMGYYGGWGDDVSELIEQEKTVLNTFQQTDKYVIMGCYPGTIKNDSAACDAYDTAMEKAFGTHYLQLNNALQSGELTSEGRAQIAQALYDKLESLGYLSSDAGTAATAGTAAE